MWGEHAARCSSSGSRGLKPLMHGVGGWRVSSISSLPILRFRPKFVTSLTPLHGRGAYDPGSVPDTVKYYAPIK